MRLLTGGRLNVLLFTSPHTSSPLATSTSCFTAAPRSSPPTIAVGGAVDFAPPVDGAVGGAVDFAPPVDGAVEGAVDLGGIVCVVLDLLGIVWGVWDIGGIVWGVLDIDGAVEGLVLGRLGVGAVVAEPSAPASAIKASSKAKSSGVSLEVR